MLPRFVDTRAQKAGRAARPSRRPAAAFLALSLLLWASLAACRSTPVPPSRPPAPVGVNPLGDQSPSVPDSVVANPLATWTPVPPGGALVPGLPDLSRPGGSNPGSGLAATAPIPPVGDIPVPTSRPAVAVPAGGPPETDPAIVRLMGMVQSPRLAADVNRLVGFGTRHVFSTASGGRGIGAARAWLVGELKGLDGRFGQAVVTDEDAFDLASSGKSAKAANVIATLPGIGLDKRLIYVIAHYDSSLKDPGDSASNAPGADDNASGTSVLLELARVLTSRRWDATIRLAALAGSEQQNAGAVHHAKAAAALDLPIVAVINNANVGGRSGQGGDESSRLMVYSGAPDESPGRRLARYVEVIAARYGPLAASLEARDGSGADGDDHLAFTRAEFAAVGLGGAAGDQGRWRTAEDTTDRLSFDYLAKVTRLNVALVGNLALAPPAPAAAPELVTVAGQRDRLTVRLPEIDDPRVAGYYVAWRTTEDPGYQGLTWAGAGTETVLGDLPAEGTLKISLAAADDLGHLGLFGSEATRR